MGHCLFMRKGETHTAPSSGILLSDIAEGSIVKLNEGGSPVEFYVAKHNYESALNGEGRTLLVRKDCYDQRAWHSSNVNAYATSDIDAWLNGDYKALLDADVQTTMGTTTFYYTPGNGNATVTTLERSIFLMSIAELLDWLPSYANSEGFTLPTYNNLSVAYNNEAAVSQWTRTPNKDKTDIALCVLTNGSSISGYSCDSAYVAWSRPCFTIPATALFDKTTMLLKGVA